MLCSYRMSTWLIQQSSSHDPIRPCGRDNGVVGCWINLKRAPLSGRQSHSKQHHLIISRPRIIPKLVSLCVWVGLAGRSGGCELIIHTCSKVCECGPTRNALVSCVSSVAPSSFATPRRRAERKRWEDPSLRRSLHHGTPLYGLLRALSN